MKLLKLVRWFEILPHGPGGGFTLNGHRLVFHIVDVSPRIRQPFADMRNDSGILFASSRVFTPHGFWQMTDEPRAAEFHEHNTASRGIPAAHL
jgi:hypothetical protein